LDLIAGSNQSMGEPNRPAFHSQAVDRLASDEVEVLAH